MIYGLLDALSPRFPRCGALPAPLRQIGEPLFLEAGATIVPDSSCCYYLQDGLVAAFADAFDGSSFLSFLLESETIFLESDILGDERLPATDMCSHFRVERDSSLLKLPAGSFRQVIAVDAESACYIARSIAQKMHAFHYLYYEAKTHGIAKQVCTLMLTFAREYGVEMGSAILIDYPLTHGIIAEMIGANRTTVSKVMKQLKSQKLLITVNDRYCIANVDAFTERLKHLN